MIRVGSVNAAGLVADEFIKKFLTRTSVQGHFFKAWINIRAFLFVFLSQLRTLLTNRCIFDILL
jgi:hypothetical protein